MALSVSRMAYASLQAWATERTELNKASRSPATSMLTEAGIACDCFCCSEASERRLCSLASTLDIAASNWRCHERMPCRYRS
eukprot:scaffold1532_cov120-Isochrysis_galbana.AAC.1